MRVIPIVKPQKLPSMIAAAAMGAGSENFLANCAATACASSSRVNASCTPRPLSAVFAPGNLTLPSASLPRWLGIEDGRGPILSRNYIALTDDPKLHAFLQQRRGPAPFLLAAPNALLAAPVIIRTGQPVRSPAIPLDGVVREGDGTMTAWVTADRRRFTRRTVKVGLARDGYNQILEGVQAGDLVATEGALFLSNAITMAAR